MSWRVIKGIKMGRFDLKCIQCIFLVIVVHGTSGDVIVDTPVGQIRGYRATDGDYNMFLGVPYAAVNRSNPFGAAVTFPKFQGVFEAKNDSNMCPQKEKIIKEILGTLDCLNVNIYVPTAAAKDPLAVILWIYGGQFIFGFAPRNFYGPSYIMKQSIILVTMNYRTGPYGFMCLDTPLVPGNQGLKDQALAMQWVKNNIAAFGGDPNRITIAGNSAGGMSIDFHLLSEQDKYYDRAIIQSGSSFNPVLYKPNKAAPFLLAKHFGKIFNNINEAISFLATIDPLQVIQTAYDLQIMKSFVPCVETKMDGVDHFITEDWVRKKNTPKVRDMDILTGFMRDEHLFLYLDLDADSLKDVKSIVDDRLVYNFDVKHTDFDERSKILQNFYLGDENSYDKKIRQLGRFDSDFSFIYPTHRSLKRFLQNFAKRVYLYEFAYVGTRNYMRHSINVTNAIGSAFHSDEIGYIFDMKFLSSPNTTDQLVIDIMTTMWANFAKYGDPTPVTSSLLPVKWLPITNDSQYFYITIDPELSAGSRPYHDRMAFWDLFYKAYYHLQTVHPSTGLAELVSEDNEFVISDDTNVSDNNRATFTGLSFIILAVNSFVMVC